MAYCTNCGAALEEGNAFCTNCGTRVDAMDASGGGTGAAYGGAIATAGQSPTSAGVSRRRRSVAVAAGATIAVSLLAVVGVLVVYPQIGGGDRQITSAVAEGSVSAERERNETATHDEGAATQDDETDASDAGNTANSKNVEGSANVGESSSLDAKNVPPSMGDGQQPSAVTITVTGEDGSTRSSDIRRDGTSERVIADSNSRSLSTAEVAALTDAERCVAWNEIIAAETGYVFKNSGLASYFSGCSWYHANPGAAGSVASPSVAASNVELLQSYTDDWWKHLALN